MQPGDIVTVHNTPDNIAQGQPAVGFGMLTAVYPGGYADLIARIDISGEIPLAGVPRGTGPDQFYAWEPRMAGSSTPALVSAENIAGLTALPYYWTRLNGIVTVHGALNVQAATPGDPAKIRIPLPVAAQLTAPSELAGVASALGATIQAHASDMAELTIPSGPGSSTLVTYSFAYLIPAP